jgi:uncharacterized membrane protein
MGVSSYLMLPHLGEQTLACGGLGDCNAVQTSKYSEVLGIPVATLGLAFCAALLSLVLWRLTGLELAIEWAPLAVFSMTLIGVAYAAYLTYIELFVLETICVWCVSLAAVITASLLISVAEILAEDEEALDAA